MDALHAYYTEIFGAFMDLPEKNIIYVDNVDVHHAMIVAAAGDNNCLDFALPYINDCDYDAAGIMLRFFYRQPGASLKPPVEWDRHSLTGFDQTEFFPEGAGRADGGDGSISMNDIGHVYVPASCREGATCRLHVALHGCEQYQEKVEEECGRDGKCQPQLFFETAGYNGWAEANDIVVLYPQTTAWNGPSLTRTNPKGCWDWWGYGGDGYATKNGKQVRAIKAMIDRLTGR
jgi:poly(3-hydroxybutyrate) depolymerase